MATARKSNPFKAGFGVDPPFFAGRHKETEVIKETLDEIKGKAGQMAEAPFSALVIAGPRGVGKTVLLGHAITAAAKRVIHTGEIDAELLSGPPTDLVNEVFPQGALERAFGRVKKVGLEFMRAGLHVELNEARKAFTSAVPVFLTKSPLMLVMDEAHTCKPEALKLLFTLVQRCMRAKLPIALIIAGTPGLEPFLKRCNATYVERSKFLRFNSLSHDEAKEAFEVPTSAGGRPLDSDALELLLDWADNYPFFVQLAGSHAWNASVKGNGKRITIQHAREGLVEADIERNAFYDGRYTELGDRGLKKFAAQSIGIIRKRTSEKTNQDYLEGRLMEMNKGMDEETVSNAVKDLLEEGFLWKDNARIYPGIPSMFDYVERERKMGSG